MVFILPVAADTVPDFVRGDLSVMVGKGQHFMAAKFDGPGFMRTDMSGFRCDDTLIRPEKGVDHGGVCLGSADEKEDIGVRRITRLTDFCLCGFRVFIKPIACCFEHVRIEQPIHNLRMGSFHVIRDKRQLIHHRI